MNYPPEMIGWATPWHVEDLSDCWFYHRCDLPGFGEVVGDWDLRSCAGDYLGNVDFEGKSVMDVGAASGFLTFEMEKRGAVVTSFDIDSGRNWNVVPHFRIRSKLPEILAGQAAVLNKIKAGYWLSHRLLGSNARAYYGDIYNMGDDLGEYDIAYFGMIIGHLRDPFSALAEAAFRTRDTMIVTSVFHPATQPSAQFYSTRDRYENLHIKSWYYVSIALVTQWLGVLGFETKEVVESKPYVKSVGLSTTSPICHTIVAQRIRD